MTRLPWQHTRTRTKSGSDKALSGPQDWFSRHTSEPSRQALTELVKAHKREKSDGSSNSGSRSRGNTIVSADGQNDGSRTVATPDDQLSRADSVRATREGSLHSSFERSESGTKALLAKGGLMLRRTGSKISLSSAGSSSTLGLTTPPRNGSGSSISRTDDLRSKISAPFDFQHVTHTEQTHFPGLRRIEQSDLANKFTAVVTRQSAAPGLRGIEASDLHAKDTVDVASQATNVAKDLPGLPASPQGPTPPPKDETSAAYVSTTLVSPRSPAFSHPLSPRSPTSTAQPTTLAIDTFLASADNSTPLASANGIVSTSGEAADLDSKPLPELPVIHAVTTDDNTARAMIAAPLPMLPRPDSLASQDGASSDRARHQRRKSSIALPRHFSLRLSAKSSMPNLLSAEPFTGLPKTLPRHHSDMALSQQVRDAQPTPDSRMSTSFGAIDIMNWEDAVDEAWDDADAASIAWDMGRAPFAVGRTPSNCNLLDSFSSEESRSAISTPLMMAAPPSQPLPPLPSERASPGSTAEVHKLESVKEDEPQTDLAGLGISSCPPSAPNGAALRLSRSSSVYNGKRRSSQCVRSDLTRSSSQESIILSIASSIIGTQRSSNSSLAADDFLGTGRIQEESESDVDEVKKAATARPESGCLPPNILEQIAKAGAAVAPAPVEADDMPPVPPMPQHKHSKSASKVAVPERKSSVASSEESRPARKRSNTAGTRPRQSARISYSLFPTTTPVPSTPTISS